MRTTILTALILCVATAASMTAQTAAQAPVTPAQDEQLAPAAAPENEDINIFLYKPRWGVGMQFGFLSGTGIAVRFHPESRFSAQFVAGGIKLSETMLWSFGVEGQFDFDIMADSRFYGLVGLGYHSVEKGDEQKLDAIFRVGLGIAYEWAISTKAVCFISLPFIYFIDPQQFYPFPQAGIIYYFR